MNKTLDVSTVKTKMAAAPPRPGVWLCRRPSRCVAAVSGKPSELVAGQGARGGEYLFWEDGVV